MTQYFNAPAILNGQELLLVRLVRVFRFSCNGGYMCACVQLCVISVSMWYGTVGVATLSVPPSWIKKYAFPGTRQFLSATVGLYFGGCSPYEIGYGNARGAARSDSSALYQWNTERAGRGFRRTKWTFALVLVIMCRLLVYCHLCSAIFCTCRSPLSGIHRSADTAWGGGAD